MPKGTPKEDRAKELDSNILEMAGGIPHLIPTPERIFARKEVAKKVEQLLEILTPKEREIVRRHIMDDEKMIKIAQDLEISLGAARGLAACALNKLRNPRPATQIRKLVR